MEEEKIKQLINEKYLHGAFNKTNLMAFKGAFHPEFSIINLQEDGHFFNFTREMWYAILEKRKADPNFDYSTIALEAKYRTIDVAEGNASVSLDLYLKDQKVYTDFLLLKKIDKDWVIVSKIYHQY